MRREQRRSPATMPGYHAGRPPRNKGLHYPADPPTVDEIIAVMPHTAGDRHGWRPRATIVVLWRAGLRIQEALALAEHDLDAALGEDARLVRVGERVVRIRRTQPRAAPVDLHRGLVMRRERQLDVIADQLGQLDRDVGQPAARLALGSAASGPTREARPTRARMISCGGLVIVLPELLRAARSTGPKMT